MDAAALHPTTGRRALLAEIGTWLAVAGAAAIIIGSGPSSALVRIGMAAGLAGVLLAWPGWARLPGLPFALALFGWGVLSIWWAGFSDPANGTCSPIAVLSPLALAIGAVAWRRPAVARALDRTLVIWCCATFLLVVLQLAIGWDRSDGTRFHVQPTGVRWTRAAGFFGNHTNAGLLFTILAVFAASPRGRDHLPTIVRWLVLVVGVVGTAYSGSRTCFAGMAIGLSFAFLRPSRRWWPSLAATIALLAAFTVFIHLTRPEMLGKIVRFDEPRIPLWHVGITVAQEHPLLGAGGDKRTTLAAQEVFPRLYPGATPEFPDVLPEPHNGFIGYAAYFGFPALILWLAVLGAVFWTACRHGGDERPLALALLVALLAASAGSMINQETGIAPLFHLVLGSCLARMALGGRDPERLPAGGGA